LEAIELLIVLSVSSWKSPVGAPLVEGPPDDAVGEVVPDEVFELLLQATMDVRPRKSAARTAPFLALLPVIETILTMLSLLGMTGCDTISLPCPPHRESDTTSRERFISGAPRRSPVTDGSRISPLDCADVQFVVRCNQPELAPIEDGNQVGNRDRVPSLLFDKYNCGTRRSDLSEGSKYLCSEEMCEPEGRLVDDQDARGPHEHRRHA
jgi:hypothetical protein